MPAQVRILPTAKDFDFWMFTLLAVWRNFLSVKVLLVGNNLNNFWTIVDNDFRPFYWTYWTIFKALSRLKMLPRRNFKWPSLLNCKYLCFFCISKEKLNEKSNFLGFIMQIRRGLMDSPARQRIELPNPLQCQQIV